MPLLPSLVFTLVATICLYHAIEAYAVGDRRRAALSMIYLAIMVSLIGTMAMSWLRDQRIPSRKLQLELGPGWDCEAGSVCVRKANGQ